MIGDRRGGRALDHESEPPLLQLAGETSLRVLVGLVVRVTTVAGATLRYTSESWRATVVTDRTDANVFGASAERARRSRSL